MNTPFFMKPLPYALFLYSNLSLGLPITVTFNNGTTNFASNGSGTANYVVNVGNITPSNAPLTFKSNPNSSNGLTANQVSTGPSRCSGVSTVCASSTFSLKANQSCCLQYALTSGNTGKYTLQPSVSTTPVPTYQSKALQQLTIKVSTIIPSIALNSAVGGYTNTANGVLPLTYHSKDSGVTWTLNNTLTLPNDAATGGNARAFLGLIGLIIE